MPRKEYRITSPENEEQNCIAYALGLKAVIWHNGFGGYRWPEGIPRSGLVDDYVKLFELFGAYEVCDDGSFEDGFTKIAIYARNNGKVTHAARQLHGAWTSKLGPSYDIRHKTAENLRGAKYGAVVRFMKTKNDPAIWNLDPYNIEPISFVEE